MAQMTIKYGVEKMRLAGRVAKGTNINTHREYLILASVKNSTNQ